MIDWRHWHNEPHLVGGLILLGWLYALAVGPFRSRLAPPGTPHPRRQAWLFYTSLVIFYLAVGSPLDQMGERFLLSAHMVQHQLILYPAPVLFWLGTPTWLIEHVTAQPRLRGLLRFLTHPIVCGASYTAIYTIWHVPALYDWALQNRWVHIVEHMTFFAGALAYWWPILSPSKTFPPSPFAVHIFYVLGITIGMTPVFAFIAFSNDILYPTYEYAPRLFATFDPKDDQLLGAAIMKLGGMFVSFLILIAAFYRWYRQGERPLAKAPVATA